MRKEDEIRDEKMSGAIRIFEALSSVEEELLERSEEQEKVVPFWRYAKVMAACAGLVVLGVATFAGTQLIPSNNSSSSDCTAQEMAEVTDDVGAAEDANEEAAAEDIMTEYDYAADEGMKPEMEEAVAQEAPAEAEEKLRASERLGNYIPTELPEGFVFADGRISNAAEEPESISITWYKGMDYITISVSEFLGEEELEARVVDVSRSETYDVHLYEIPYASSVPEEVRTTFEAPIFKESDFSLEMVEARMKSESEMGDTDTPRGNFAVLYDTGVVVSFTGRGDAETIWNLFQSIKAK